MPHLEKKAVLVQEQEVISIPQPSFRPTSATHVFRAGPSSAREQEESWGQSSVATFLLPLLSSSWRGPKVTSPPI